jgi:hypothetical protein
MLHKLLFAIVLGISMIYGVASAQPAGRPPLGPPIDVQAMRHRAELLHRYDTNKDHRLDKAEKAAMRDARARAHFAALDADRDGVLSLREFEREPAPPAQHARK